MKKIGLRLMFAVLLALLTACGGTGREPDSGREQVTIAFWGDQLTERYGSYLRDAFPEVEFTFYNATNSTDFYRFKQERGDLPDILTVRRFALRDVADWKDSLMDLSDTDLANAFPQAYLRSYTYSDGAVNWLPACAEVDSIIVNKTLLEDNGLTVPANYGEFTALCGALREKGIRPFLSNFSADYTCMEVLQGLSASALTSQAGREWRQQYESGQTDQLSEEVWLPVFQRMAELIDCAGIGPADADDSISVFEEYEAGRAAMVRGTGAEAARYSSESRASLLMPYFGESEEENWYLTYPTFQIAASARAEESPERKELILDILRAMLGEEGLRHISPNQNMVPYSRDVTIDLSPSLTPIVPYIEANRLYIRLASADMFSVSKQVVQAMIAGEYPDARAAFDAFNLALAAPKAPAPAAVRIETGYDYAFSPEGGSPAASAIMNSVREEVGADLLIGPAASVAGNITPGAYTEAELSFLTMGEDTGVALCDMTGEQIFQYAGYVLTTPGKRGSVINDSTLYVSSGFEMSVRRTEAGYALEALTVDGAALDRDAVYSVALVGSISMMVQEALDTVGVTDCQCMEGVYKRIVVDRLAGGKPLAEPTDYITLQ